MLMIQGVRKRKVYAGSERAETDLAVGDSDPAFRIRGERGEPRGAQRNTGKRTQGKPLTATLLTATRAKLGLHLL